MSHRQTKVVYVVPDVQHLEALEWDRRIGEPQIVFAGVVPVQNAADRLSINPGQVQVRPSFNAVFLVPMHLMSDEAALGIGRGLPTQVIDTTAADFEADLAS